MQKIIEACEKLLNDLKRLLMDEKRLLTDEKISKLIKIHLIEKKK
jgi:flagellar biosynthesis/type III secretory pathway chaperone